PKAARSAALQDAGAKRGQSSVSRLNPPAQIDVRFVAALGAAAHLKARRDHVGQEDAPTSFELPRFRVIQAGIMAGWCAGAPACRPPPELASPQEWDCAGPARSGAAATKARALQGTLSAALKLKGECA